jgi:transcription termination factor NusB
MLFRDWFLAKIQMPDNVTIIDYVLTHQNEYQKKIDSTLRSVSYKKLFKNETKIIIVPLAFVDLRQEDLDQNITAKLTLFELNTLLKLKREKSNEVILDPIVFASGSGGIL